MKFKFMCEKCGEDITNSCYYDNDDGYFYVEADCKKCETHNSIDLTDYFPHSMDYEEEEREDDFEEDEDDFEHPSLCPICLHSWWTCECNDTKSAEDYE